MRKNKGLIIGIIVLAVIALGLGGFAIYKTSANKKAEQMELSKTNLENSITLTVKDEYLNSIELTKDSTFIDPLDMVTISVNGSTIDPKVTNEKVNVTCDTSLIDTSKNQSYTVKYTVTAFDEYEQEVTKDFSQIYTVKDTEKPVIELKESEVTINNAQSYDPASNVTVTDNHDTISKVNSLSNGLAGFVVEGEWSNTTAGTYTLTVKAKDGDDNYADEKTFKLTVKAISSSSNKSDNKNANSDGSTNSTMNAETYKVSQAIDTTIAVRQGAGTMNNKVKYSDLSADAQKYTKADENGYAYIEGNDVFTVYDVQEDNASNKWGRIDATVNAWVCIQYGDETWASAQ